MTRLYASFLIRCWLLDGGEQRIKVEHIQSGDSIQVATPTAAINWISAHWSNSPGATNGGQGGQLQRHPLFQDEQNIPPGMYDS